ncbi:MAG: ABC transporter permease [Candidatus Rokuibacteriota bacterium]|nr:MAG: ABC transporter permease [Candidatus Rokubacteria bacterium]
MAGDPRLIADRPGLAGTLEGVWRRVSQGEIGSLPVVAALILIAIVFQSLNPNFLTPRNLTNLVLQIAAMGTISVGVVLVLLLGEIDLSVGAVSGLCAAVMAVLNVKAGLPGALAVGVGVLAGAGIGLLQGVWITRFRVPSFVVTLAGLLGWQGLLLWVLGDTGTVNLTDPAITNLAGIFLGPRLGWFVGLAAVAVFLASLSRARRRRVAAGLGVGTTGALVARIVLVGGGILLAIAVLDAGRGVPLAMLILLGFVVAFDWVTTRTGWGRHVFAVGGNAEAARRAGVAVDRVRVLVFTLSATLAACGGILAASRLLAVNQSSGSGDVVLNAIAAAVIGGTSLFGGRGTIWSALLGALVIGSISNGMDLLALASSVKFMITGGVLLAAVTIDAVSRRGRQAAGRA